MQNWRGLYLLPPPIVVATRGSLAFHSSLPLRWITLDGALAEESKECYCGEPPQNRRRGRELRRSCFGETAKASSSTNLISVFGLGQISTLLGPGGFPCRCYEEIFHSGWMGRPFRSLDGAVSFVLDIDDGSIVGGRDFYPPGKWRALFHPATCENCCFYLRLPEPNVTIDADPASEELSLPSTLASAASLSLPAAEGFRGSCNLPSVLTAVDTSCLNNAAPVFLPKSKPDPTAAYAPRPTLQFQPCSLLCYHSRIQHGGCYCDY
ncbi:hypothetical protein GALMADRAFT_243710 [Galerina marginata CBS 339.88]|uniref:Uncharacterized protein n=1 Tax=Galerina marginata (strain CBS 339.88) TaxID=685588 RepID=A0A067TKX8_GALM3|nr:hypothetical protein GALMADRAFT_243710 [Galerina marginata CBS 339.88]